MTDRVEGLFLKGRIFCFKASIGSMPRCSGVLGIDAAVILPTLTFPMSHLFHPVSEVSGFGFF